jgi:hypothetical protein
MLGQFHASSDFTPVEKVSRIHGIGGWLEPRADMGFWGGDKSFVPARNRNPDRLACTWVKGKGKAVPLQAWSDPEGYRKLRFPDFMTTVQDGGKVSLTHQPSLPPGNTPGTHFC